MKKLVPVVAIDGSSGAGKSVLSQNISEALKWNLLESGLIYRLVSFIILKNKLSVDIKNVDVIEKKLDSYLNLQNDFLKNYYFMNVLKKKLMLQNIVNFASEIAILPHIRKFLLYKQRLFRKSPGLVTNGRDMGTVVFPDAIVKIFLYADIKIRAKRRISELQNNGISANFNSILSDMQKRDQRDQNRLCCPLSVPKDALIINSTDINIEEVFNIAIRYIYKKLN